MILTLKEPYSLMTAQTENTRNPQNIVHYCDREPEKEPEIMRQIEAFVKHFIKMYERKQIKL